MLYSINIFVPISGPSGAADVSTWRHSLEGPIKTYQGSRDQTKHLEVSGENMSKLLKAYSNSPTWGELG